MGQSLCKAMCSIMKKFKKRKEKKKKERTCDVTTTLLAASPLAVSVETVLLISVSPTQSFQEESSQRTLVK